MPNQSTRNIAVFYHCLLETGEPPALSENALYVVNEQMELLKQSGLSAHEMYVGVNGTSGIEAVVQNLVPNGAMVIGHGPHCRNECRTIMLIQDWLLGHPKGWNVLYFHAKGATHPLNEGRSTQWRHCMMSQLVWNWRRCVSDLDRYDSVGCHWMSGDNNPVGNSIWAGNFWWATSEFLSTLPRIERCPRVVTGQSALDSVDTRFEAEVWIGNGPTLPRVRDYHPGSPFRCTG